ncbi:YceI family protein [Thiohalorhabdus sp.]|uniref:YceI family protein n=1 Tax=Thiohalorhabdus sp. TaxID=3094134 RepID=UPI002FC39240
MFRLISLFLLAIVSLPTAAAEWQLDGERSSLYFLSIKKNEVAETHHFDRLSGKYAKGQAQLAIDLASLETGIDIRDKRMREKLFEVDTYPSAAITVAVAEQRVTDLKPGEQTLLDATAELELHGNRQRVDTALTVTRLADGTLQVANARPLVINAGAFELARGVEKLRAIAGLPSISPAVPVQFSLYFEKQ